MKAAIMGAGAMGTVLGAFLTRNGFPVDLIDSYPAQVDALNEKGAGVVGCAELTVPVRALLPEQMEGVYDLVFLMVKQTNNEASLRALLPHLGENSTVCTLQNGVPELAVAEFVGRNRTVGGACRWGATFVEPGISELTNALSARTVLFEIGEIDGRITDRIRAVAKVLGHMDNGKVEITDNLMGARWLKLMLNCCMSGLSSALGCTFESVISSEKALACTSYLAAEVVHAARAAGFQLTDTNGLNTAEIADFQTRGGTIMRNDHTIEERLEAVLACLEGGRALQEVAQAHQVAVQTLRSWVKKYQELGPAGLEDRRGKRLADQTPRSRDEALRIENARLKKENELLKMELYLRKKVQELERGDR